MSKEDLKEYNKVNNITKRFPALTNHPDTL